MAVALLIPFTFHLQPAQGLILLGAAYTSTVAGGAVSAILLKIPGAPANIATTLDGHTMAQQGRGARALQLSFRAQEAGNVRILGVADLERSSFLPDVPTMKEQGLDVDNASVNFRGIMVPKETPQPIIDKLAAIVPEMFNNKKVVSRMKAGGSPMAVMTRDEIKAMWAAREETLKVLLEGL